MLSWSHISDMWIRLHPVLGKDKEEEEEEEEKEEEEDMEEKEELGAGAMACRRWGRLQHQYRGCPSARSPTPALTHQCQAVFPKEKVLVCSY